jgi:omega-6 fatty acid desaturase (delta-12 desaturase)
LAIPAEKNRQIMKNNSAVLARNAPEADKMAWKEVVAKYQEPVLWRSSWQIANTLVPYAAVWVLMYFALKISAWLVVPLAILASGFLVRIFIIHHDCGHGAYFRSRRANDFWGCITGVLTFTPYALWRWEHAIHHASSGDLDRRGTGDVWTMTVQEYRQATRRKRLAYRLARNPVVLFVIAPLFLFLIWHRVPPARAGRRQRRSVLWTNAAILAVAVAMSVVFGWKAYLAIQVAIVGLAGTAGVWLFYVQHQFEGVYWERGENWEYVTAALRGSSFYKLPKLLQWFSGNIGYHHIHHLSSRIPNYNLPRCHNAEPLFQTVQPVGLLASLKALRFRLWDEQARTLVGFRQLKRQHR